MACLCPGKESACYVECLGVHLGENSISSRGGLQTERQPGLILLFSLFMIFFMMATGGGSLSRGNMLVCIKGHRWGGGCLPVQREDAALLMCSTPLCAALGGDGGRLPVPKQDAALLEAQHSQSRFLLDALHSVLNHEVLSFVQVMYRYII